MFTVCSLKKKKEERKWTRPDHLAEGFQLVKKKKKKEKERATFVESSRLENSSLNDISYEQLKIGIRKELSIKPQVRASASCSRIPITRAGVGSGTAPRVLSLPATLGPGEGRGNPLGHSIPLPAGCW